MSLFSKYNFIDSNKYKSQIEDYMNATYGKACDDSFKVISVQYADMTTADNVFTLSSSSFPDNTVLVSHNLATKSICTNYMEVFYSVPVMEFMRQEVKEVFGPCKIVYEYTPGAPCCPLDYTCSQEQFLETVGSSFTLFLKHDCPFASAEHLPKALEALRDDCTKVGIRLKTIDVVILSRLYDGEINSYQQFEDKYLLLQQQISSYSLEGDITLI